MISLNISLKKEIKIKLHIFKLNIKWHCMGKSIKKVDVLKGNYKEFLGYF